jgi:hypothetical protein
MGIIFFHYNFLFLTTILTLRFVLLDERTARKSPNSCRFVLLEGVLLDEFHSIKIRSVFSKLNDLNLC